MRIEDLAVEEDALDYFEDMSDLDALIMAWVEGGKMYYKCAVNPGIDPGRELGALGWCAQMVTRIEDYGFDEAMRMDASQHRSDGAWQLWGRAVQLPTLD